MSLFNLIKKPQPAKIGNTDSICPYCQVPLAHRPGRKAKCPACGNYIYVRTRPADRQQVLVTQTQAEQIDEEWTIVNGTHDHYVAEKENFAEEKSRLKARHKTDPSDNDVQWSLLNKQSLAAAQAGNWGTYRNTKFQQAEIVRREGRWDAALALYLDVCYLDLNGPQNNGGLTTIQRPAFDPARAILADGVLGRISSMIAKLNFDEEQTHATYQHVAELSHRSLRLPIAPEAAWRQIRERLFP